MNVSRQLVNVRWLAILALLALSIVLVNHAQHGQYNVHWNVVADPGGNTRDGNSTNFPKCDNSLAFFLRMTIEWAQGNYMAHGMDCHIATISGEEVTRRMEQWMLQHNIDPAMANEEMLARVQAEVLHEWAMGVLY